MITAVCDKAALHASFIENLWLWFTGLPSTE